MYQTLLGQIECTKRDLKSLIRGKESLEHEVTRSYEVIEEISTLKQNLKTQTFDNSERENQLKQIKKEQEELSIVVENRSNIEERIYQARQWLIHFKDFKSYLAHQFLQVIEGLTNRYLIELGSDIQIKWEGFKVKADGTLSDKITPLIYRDGIEQEFGLYSGGERARMEFCLLLTIRELINTTHPRGGLDFMFVDEIFESLDARGLTNMLKSINHFHYPVLITTQKRDVNLHSQVLKIIKENGISRLDL